MPGIRAAGTLLITAAVLIASLAEDAIAGVQPHEAALLVGFFGMAMILAGAIVDGFGQHWTHGVQATAVTFGVLIGALLLYSSRSEILAVLDRTIGDVAPGRTVVNPEGEVVAARRSDGTFLVTGQVNGRDARFIFDTGASTIVLRAEDAAHLGVKADSLTYSVPVSTANGMALAAPVTIASLALGPIEERNVRALVARAGVLQINLLGMSFLERLSSYEVRGNRLILRGKGA
ncbi:retropepsin-like aspartic protease family protein [Microvirga antarctica]|uniref:retropepsin-like aspartic protease family protein n=1 Tax=Microvirga antarctica TaxID=2819233 RepID=UPI001B30ECC8|nr:TIGR02281 family clan AA aspartic protease [Microvirga antarctica]